MLNNLPLPQNYLSINVEAINNFIAVYARSPVTNTYELIQLDTGVPIGTDKIKVLEDDKLLIDGSNYLREHGQEYEMTWFYTRHMHATDISDPVRYRKNLEVSDIFLKESYGATKELLSLLKKVSEAKIDTKLDEIVQLSEFALSQFSIAQLKLLQGTGVYADTFDITAQILGTVDKRVYALYKMDRYLSKVSQCIHKDLSTLTTKHSNEDWNTIRELMRIRAVVGWSYSYYREQIWRYSLGLSLLGYNTYTPSKPSIVKVFATAGAGHYGFGRLIGKEFDIKATEILDYEDAHNGHNSIAKLAAKKRSSSFKYASKIA